MEVLFAGEAAHSMAGRTSQVAKFDGVEENHISTFSRLLPTVSIVKVVAGNTASHFFFLGADGTAFAWGRNEDCQLGLNDDVNRYNATKVPFPEGTGPIIGGTCGSWSSYLFSADGELFSCGLNSCGQLGVGSVDAEPTRVFRKVELDDEKCISIGAGKDFAVCCTKEGNCFSWGSPEFGQLGNGSENKTLEKAGKWTFSYRTVPKKIEKIRKFEPECGIVSVACGQNHALALDAQGRIYSWGFGGYGRLGHGDAKDKFEPEPIAGFCNEPPPPNPKIPAFAQRLQPRLRAVKISCGNSASYAIAGEPFFSLYFWGITKKAGEATLKPVIYEELQGLKIVDIACGMSSTIIVTNDNMVVTWGPSPTHGELGYGEGNAKSSTKVKEVESLRGGKFAAGCLAAGLSASFVIINAEDEESKKVLESCPTLTLADLSASKKREAGAAAAPSTKSSTTEKKTKKKS